MSENEWKDRAYLGPNTPEFGMVAMSDAEQMSPKRVSKDVIDSIVETIDSASCRHVQRMPGIRSNDTTDQNQSRAKSGYMESMLHSSTRKTDLTRSLEARSAFGS